MLHFDVKHVLTSVAMFLVIIDENW